MKPQKSRERNRAIKAINQGKVMVRDRQIMVKRVENPRKSPVSPRTMMNNPRTMMNKKGMLSKVLVVMAWGLCVGMVIIFLSLVMAWGYGVFVRGRGSKVLVVMAWSCGVCVGLVMAWGHGSWACDGISPKS